MQELVEVVFRSERTGYFINSKELEIVPDSKVVVKVERGEDIGRVLNCSVNDSSVEEKLKDESFFTGDVYNHYQSLCERDKIEVLTQRRVSDIIQEFDMLGILNVKIISKGRGGRMREIKLAISKNLCAKAKEIVENSLDYC